MTKKKGIFLATWLSLSAVAVSRIWRECNIYVYLTNPILWHGEK